MSAEVVDEFITLTSPHVSVSLVLTDLIDRLMIDSCSQVSGRGIPLPRDHFTIFVQREEVVYLYHSPPVHVV